MVSNVLLNRPLPLGVEIHDLYHTDGTDCADRATVYRGAPFFFSEAPTSRKEVLYPPPKNRRLYFEKKIAPVARGVGSQRSILYSTLQLTVVVPL